MLTVWIWVLLCPALCMLLAWQWRFPVWSGAVTGFLWGPFGPVALWTASKPAVEPCEDCGRLIPLDEMTCRYCGAEYVDDDG